MKNFSEWLAYRNGLKEAVVELDRLVTTKDPSPDPLAYAGGGRQFGKTARDRPETVTRITHVRELNKNRLALARIETNGTTLVEMWHDKANKDNYWTWYIPPKKGSARNGDVITDPARIKKFQDIIMSGGEPPLTVVITKLGEERFKKFGIPLPNNVQVVNNYFDHYWVKKLPDGEEERVHPSQWDKLTQQAAKQAPYGGPVEREPILGTKELDVTDWAKVMAAQRAGITLEPGEEKKRIKRSDVLSYDPKIKIGAPLSASGKRQRAKQRVVVPGGKVELVEYGYKCPDVTHVGKREKNQVFIATKNWQETTPRGQINMVKLACGHEHPVEKLEPFVIRPNGKVLSADQVTPIPEFTTVTKAKEVDWSDKSNMPRSYKTSPAEAKAAGYSFKSGEEDLASMGTQEPYWGK